MISAKPFFSRLFRAPPSLVQSLCYFTIFFLFVCRFLLLTVLCVLVLCRFQERNMDEETASLRQWPKDLTDDFRTALKPIAKGWFNVNESR